MSDDVNPQTSDPRCVQCGATRSVARAERLDCAIVSGYEYPEIEAEWDRHHWRPWSDRELAQVGIRPEAFEKYRRTAATWLPWAACEDTVRGHVPATSGDVDFLAERVGQCICCGKDVQAATPAKEPADV